MTTRSRDVRSHFFTLRIWSEPLEDDRVEWRGKLKYVPDGDSRYFRGWDTLVHHLRDFLEEQEQPPPP